MGLTDGRNIHFYGNVTLSQRANQVTERQAHNPGKAAAKVGNRLKTGVLDSIGTSFVERIAGCDIAFNLLIAVISHRHIYGRSIGHSLSVGFVDNG
jgi:hypothetical protein